MKFPFDENQKFEYDEERDSVTGLPKRLKYMFLEDELNRTSKVAPDTTGADKYFIDGFITEEMELDFWVIAKDFLQHHYPRLKEFNDLVVYGNDKPEQSDPEGALQRKILNIMYNAAKSGDTYSVELMKQLYKTYHKKEYQQLKRFRKITIPEIFSLAETEDGGCDYLVISRVLAMCAIFGIEMEEHCSVLYLMQGRARKEWDKENEKEFFHFPEGLFQECYDQVEEWMRQYCKTKEQTRKGMAEYWKADRFAEYCLKRHGFPEDYLYRCNLEYMGINRLLAVTLALLKSAYPNEEFSFEEVQTYALIAHCIDAVISTVDVYEEGITEMLGIEPELNKLRESLFKPGSIIVAENSKAKQVAKPVTVAPIINNDVNEEDYIKEIDELRRRLREKDEECKYFRRQYEQAKVELSDAIEAVAQNANYMEELIILRNYVYSLSQEVPQITEDKLEDMQQVIAEKNVIIVGGHVNWINKLKKEFPNWRYLDANISRTNDSKLVEGADKVYFFTDHLSHGTYGKFVKLVRENRIPFGYMHSVNMDSMVRQVYEDLIEK